MAWKKYEAKCEYLYDRIQSGLNQYNNRLEQIERIVDEWKKDVIRQYVYLVIALLIVLLLVIGRGYVDGYAFGYAFLPFYDMILVVGTVWMILMNIRGIIRKRKRLHSGLHPSGAVTDPAQTIADARGFAVRPQTLYDEKMLLEWLAEQYWKELIALNGIQKQIASNQGEYDEEIEAKLDAVIEYAEVETAKNMRI